MMDEFATIAIVAYLFIGLVVVGHATFKQRKYMRSLFKHLGIFKATILALLLCVLLIMNVIVWPSLLKVTIGPVMK